MTEQEIQLQIAIEQGKANALRQEVAEMNKEREYWQHYRIQAAIAAMQGMLANETHSASVGIIAKEDGKSNTEVMAEAAVQLADALIAELQKKQD